MLTNHPTKADKGEKPVEPATSNKIGVSQASTSVAEGEVPRTEFSETSPRVDWKSQYGIDCVDMVHFHHW